MFTYNKKILYILLAISAIKVLLTSSQVSLLSFVLSVPALLVAITFHEFAHAFVADKLGDDTPRNQGRLTLNPLAHLDPVGCFLLIFAGFGWGKPVEVNPRNYDRKYTMTQADAMVSAAGPIMNFILAIIFTFIYFLIIRINPYLLVDKFGSIILQIVNSCISMNVVLGLFNLIPLPPLDGSKIIKHFLPYNAREWFERNEQIFYFIFLAIWITGLTSYIISPLLNGAYTLLFNGIGKIMGVL